MGTLVAMSVIKVMLAFAIVAAAHPPLLYTNYASGEPNKTTTSNSTWTFSTKSSLLVPSSLQFDRTSTLSDPNSLNTFSSGSLTEAPTTFLSQTFLSIRNLSISTSSTSGVSTPLTITSPTPLPTKYPFALYSNSTNLNSTLSKSYNNASSKTYPKYAQTAAIGSGFLPAPSGHTPGKGSNTTALPANGTWAYSLKNVSSIPLKSSAPLLQVTAVREKPKKVFAHFMVSNVAHWLVPQWEADMELAKQAHIDGFALNIANNEEGNLHSIDEAFGAALNKGFKLIFSFDYAGNGSWDKTTVINLINKYKGYSTYYKHLSSGPLVSTFEGFDKASDWIDIKASTGCFFIPDWSSKGAMDALKPGVANGLFSWAAWPWGNTDMDTYVDASYLDYLEQAGADKVYMMPVSPWFFTNLPFWEKNWLWRGDDLWRDRWEQVMQVQPDYVQIITWNDYGESHYIGPLRDGVYGAFGKGLAPYNYVLDMPHDGWRQLLPYWIDTYKNGRATIAQEKLVIWYRLYPAASVVCADGGTTGNTATQLQAEFSPREVVQDKIFFSALLTSPSTVTVTVGGVALAAVWTDVPYDGIGVHHGSAFYGSAAGQVVVTVQRVPSIVGKAIATSCQNNVINWNAWVGSSKGVAITGKTPSLTVENQRCIKGTAPIGFRGMCEFTCAYGYCPIGACQCLAMGELKKPPASTGKIGYPIAGKSSSYKGLCKFACDLGFCPSSTCGYTLQTLVEPTVSPFLPSACNRGTSIVADGDLKGLCEYSCNVGFCPIHVCKCTRLGGLNEPNGVIANAWGVGYNDDAGLCKFACARGYCPPRPCMDGEAQVAVCYDNDERPECQYDVPFCNLELEFENLDILYSKMSEFPRICANIYTLDTLSNLLENSLSGFDAINEGYDHAFGYYKKWVRNMIPQALGVFMNPDNGPGNKYFDCTNLSGVTVQCPFSNQASWAYEWTVRYTLKDEVGFWKELNEKYGVTQEWVKFGTTTETFCFEGGRIAPTSEAPSTKAPVSKRCTFARTHISIDIPIPKPDGEIVIPDPKQIITDTLPKMKELRNSLDATMFDMMSGQWEGSDDDALQVLSMPVFLILQAIESMKKVKDIGEDVEESEKQTLIMLVITAIFFFLPFAGPVAAAGGAVTAGRVIAMIALGGDVALGMKEIVENPDSAAIVILGLILGGVGWRNPSSLSSMAKTRNGLKGTDVAKMGDTFKAHDDILQKIVKSCTR